MFYNAQLLGSIMLSKLSNGDIFGKHDLHLIVSHVAILLKLRGSVY